MHRAASRTFAVALIVSAAACSADSTVAPRDAGSNDGPVSDASSIPATYYDFTDTSNWSTFDLASVGGLGGEIFYNGGFDGQHVYFVGQGPNAGVNGLVARYDSRLPFDDTGSWSSFNVQTVAPKALANRGAAFDGRRLYVTVGSNSNIAENGMENEAGRAAILEIDPATRTSRIYASGLRNPNGLGLQPQTGALWTVVNERDELGSDLVPDYLTSVKDGGFYGWPWSYYGAHADDRVQPRRPDMMATAIVPDYALGAHVAPLGLAFYGDALLGSRFLGGAFVGEHGSWNRRPRSGYAVVFVPFVDGRPSGLPEAVLSGFVDGAGNALGRPVGVAIDRAGALLVADDVGNVVWRVTPASTPR